MRGVELAHRAVVAVTVLGVMGRRIERGLRVNVAELGAVTDAPADLVVTFDQGTVGAAEIGAAFGRMRAAITDDGAVVLVASSPVTAAFARTAPLRSERDDAFAQAMTWAAVRASDPGPIVAPAVEPSRLAQIVDAAAKSDLTLVEPEIGLVAPGLARVRGIRSPRARAMLATIALGSAAHPFVFVPLARAPKGGLARAKVEKLANGWVAARVTPTKVDDTDATALICAALEVLGPGPRAFKDLLREARDRWSAKARATGGRATASARDASDLAAVLYRLAADDRVDLWALDPADPGWKLTSVEQT